MVTDHPGQDAILKATLKANFSFTEGKEAHFSATAAAFRSASEAFDAQSPKQPLDFTFHRSRANGGLNHNGDPVGPVPLTPVGTVTILGKLSD